MKKLFAVMVFVISNFSCAQAKSSLVEEPSTRFDFRSIGIAQVVQLIYAEALPGSYVIDPQVLTDQRLVSFRYEGDKQGVRAFIASFFDSLGLAVTRRGSIDFIAQKVAAASSQPDDEVLVYRPRFRDGSYLVEILAPLFKGAFTSRRSVRASPSDGASSNKLAPAGTAAAMIDRKSDTIVFSGPAAEVAKLRNLFSQVDVSSGDVLVRGVLYEVQTSKKDGSAFGMALNLLSGKIGVGIGSLVASPGDAFVSLKNKSIDAVLSVLASDSRFKAVSKPMLRVASGGSGRFTVGQDVPVLGAVSYPGNGLPAVQSISYQSSGVIYDVQPVIRDAVIDVSVMQQTSNFVSTSTGVSGSPTLIKRELKSDLTLADGEIVVMGGLTDSKDTNASQGASFLPSFMRSKSSDTSGVEILLILQVTRL